MALLEQSRVSRKKQRLTRLGFSGVPAIHSVAGWRTAYRSPTSACRQLASGAIQDSRSEPPRVSNQASDHSASENSRTSLCRTPDSGRRSRRHPDVSRYREIPEQTVPANGGRLAKIPLMGAKHPMKAHENGGTGHKGGNGPSRDARRPVLEWILSGGVAASLASFFYPVIRFINPPHIAEAAVDEVLAGKVQDLKVRSGKLVKFGNKPALLVRVTETEWKAFSAVCTHLNCTVQYQESSSQIWCACHNGYYDLTGRAVSGPPPKALDEYTVRIRGDEVVISRRT